MMKWGEAAEVSLSGPDGMDAVWIASDRIGGGGVNKEKKKVYCTIFGG